MNNFIKAEDADNKRPLLFLFVDVMHNFIKQKTFGLTIFVVEEEKAIKGLVTGGLYVF